MSGFRFCGIGTLILLRQLADDGQGIRPAEEQLSCCFSTVRKDRFLLFSPRAERVEGK